ncbi:M15 family metallopeptidase [Clostridium sp. BJN0001]|uniref:M15 family metallopeptidase n=1 Tax=Clostridium sp. BJN0001 TaxID=2930219 RepID=UPI001FD0CD4D|nr:M15 family metallopeptidase [Clostridium sp. BJN0001]
MRYLRRKKRKRKFFKCLLFLIMIFLGFDYVYNTELNQVLDKDNVIKGIMIVNKEHPIKEDYTPDDLTYVTVRDSTSTDEEKEVSKKIVKPLKRLFDAADKDGIKLYVISAYRSYKSQKNLYDYYEKKMGKDYVRRYVSKPGQSEHQTGLCLDVANSARNFNNSKEAAWISKNSYKYGFILRYPKDKIEVTGYNYESWHIRYVGEDAAKKMHDNNLCLEEYLK